MSDHNRKKGISQIKKNETFAEGRKRAADTAVVRYLEFVYYTRKVIYSGQRDTLQSGVAALFWHGESYCLYPAVEGHEVSKQYIHCKTDVPELCA